MPEWLPTDLLDKHEAAAYLGITVHTWRNHCYHQQRGTAPPPDGLKQNRNAWLRSTLDAWRVEHPTNLMETQR